MGYRGRLAKCVVCGDPIYRNRAYSHGAYGKDLVTCGKVSCQAARKTITQRERRARKRSEATPRGVTEATTIDVASGIDNLHKSFSI